MIDSVVTLQGWVGNDADVRELPDGQLVTFRVGSTPRYQNKAGEWVDGQTSWFTVRCWRQLAANVAKSVHKGDAVVVHGRVRVESWAPDGQPPVTYWTIDATFVGHDLNRGVSSFTKPQRQQESSPESRPESSERAA